MTGELAHRMGTQAAIAINRFGSEVTLYEPDTVTRNTRGKVSDADQTFTEFGTETARRMYPNRSDRPSQQLASGGRFDRDTPVVAFLDSTDAEEGYHVEFPDGIRYVIDTIGDADAYKEAEVTLYNE